MGYILTKEAINEMKKMDDNEKAIFAARFDKIVKNPATRHSIKYCIENAGAGRIIYRIKEDEGIIYIVHCFQDHHKTYDKWRDEQR